MRVNKFFRFCLPLLLSCSTAVAAPGELGDNGGVNANPHNLSSLSQNTIKATSETQICIFCHIPHGSTYQSTLWGRPDPIGGPFPTFDPSKTKDPNSNFGIDDAAIVGTTLYGQGEYPNGASKMCLSCHDGVTAIGTLSNYDEIAINGSIGASMSSVGSTQHFGSGGSLSLSTSHPISFVYTQAVVNYLNSNSPTDIKFYNFTLPTSIKLDSQNRVQCTICHEPHKDTRGTGHVYPFWRMAGKGANAAADYDLTCRECHSTTYYSGSNHNIP